MTPVEIISGSGPLVLGLPHTGTYLPADIWAGLNDAGRALTDTDWHIGELYRDLVPDATIVRATFHRYVIDANRAPDGASLYPGQNTTGLCPVTDFDGHPIWRPGAAPDAGDVDTRRVAFHAPYHAALKDALDRTRARHGVAILYDCHSIRSRVPFLFDGQLPDFNIGTNDGTSCDPAIERTVREIAEGAADFTSVLNGRFKGGWATRHYGNPPAGMHAIQMELAQCTYMTETPPWTYDARRAVPLRNVLGRLLESLADLAPKLGEPNV